MASGVGPRNFEPGYVALLRNGELRQRVQRGWEMLSACIACGWSCKANRLEEKKGVCHTGSHARVGSYGPHLGEEKPLRGWRGSGTIFFSRCNMRCQFCQNHDISQANAGDEVEPEDIAAMMLELQAYGCHNINFVSPTHVTAQILAAVYIAAQAGLNIPLVYNTGGYDSLPALELLDGVVDIYMPDMKYASKAIARFYSKIPHYPEVNQAAVREMHRQVGDLVLDEQGLAQRGLIIRHLVLPDGMAGTAEIARFVAEEISQETYFNLMDQYHPDYLASQYPRLKKPVTKDEYQAAFQAAHVAGLHRFD